MFCLDSSRKSKENFDFEKNNRHFSCFEIRNYLQKLKHHLEDSSKFVTKIFLIFEK